MDEMNGIYRRLRVSKLQVRREQIEIKQDALSREIDSPLTSQDRREEALMMRDELMSQLAEIVEELKIHVGN